MSEDKVTQLPPPTQTMKCVIVPIEVMDQVQDVLKEAPFKSARPVLERLSTCPVQDVQVTPNDAGSNPNQT